MVTAMANDTLMGVEQRQLISVSHPRKEYSLF